MSTHKRSAEQQTIAAKAIPRLQWSEFLRSLSKRHNRRPVQLETHDVETGEEVVSPETPLQSIELDLEDEKNPRINVIVELDNKVIKHILFQPSHLVYRREEGGEALQIDSVNTVTTVRFPKAQAA
jgi:hypothetical protein